MISDEVTEVYFNSDRILHMAGGRIVAEYDPRPGSPSPIWSAPSMRDYLRTHEGEVRLFVVLAALTLYLAIASPIFFTAGNLASLLNNTPST